MDFEIITLNKKNITDFAEARNELLKNAKSDWVFFLDSDEQLSKELKSEIEKLEPSGYEGFFVNRKNYFLGKYIGTDNILRLGRKSAGKWLRKVHEVWRVSGKVGQLKNPIIHYSYKSLHEAIKKTNSYSSLHAEENLREGKKSGLFKIIFYPPAKFIQSILMSRGFVFSMLQSFHSFLAWSKIWVSQNT